MKIKTPQQITIKSEEFENSKMTIDDDQKDIVALILRDRIYTDKKAAVVREYACNALDEHCKHKVERPIEITLTETYLLIRDFAKGLSEQFIFEVYGMIGKSMKTDRDDLIGGYGLGSKSGHAYGDQFTITSFFEGKKTVYLAALETGKNGVAVGVINKVMQMDSDEPTGIEINIPIQTGDYYSFNNIVKDFVAGVRVPVLFNGECSSSMMHSKWADTNHLEYSRNKVRVGDVLYNVPFDTILKNNFIDITIDLPIDSVSIPPSRELIDNTESNKRVVNEAIEKLLEDTKNEIIEKLEDIKINEAFDLICSNRLYKYVTKHNDITKDGIRITENSDFLSIFKREPMFRQFMNWDDAYCMNPSYGSDRVYPKVKKCELKEVNCLKFLISKKRCGKVLAKMIEQHYRSIVGNFSNSFYVIWENEDNKDFIDFIRQKLNCEDVDDSCYSNAKEFSKKNAMGKVQLERLHGVLNGRLYNGHKQVSELEPKEPVFYIPWSESITHNYYIGERVYYKLTKRQVELLTDTGFKLIHAKEAKKYRKEQALKRVSSKAKKNFVLHHFRNLHRDSIKVVEKYFDTKGIFDLDEVSYKAQMLELCDIDVEPSELGSKWIDNWTKELYKCAPEWKINTIKILERFEVEDQKMKAINAIIKSKKK